jgi:protein phosphatase
MKLTACGRTDVGLSRSNNQDSFFADEHLGLFIVADGMGGHKAGEIASHMAITSVARQLEPLLRQQPQVEVLQQKLAEVVEAAHREVTTAAAENPAWSGMGTTLTLLLLYAGQALLAHVGDSRLYRWRDQQLELLSKDQTLVAEQLRQGIISETEAGHSNLRGLLLQAVGASEQLDVFQQEQQLQENDSFLLCSDGLTGMLSDTDIHSVLARNPQPEAVCDKLIKQALQAGGKDNVTVLMVTMRDK